MPCAVLKTTQPVDAALQDELTAGIKKAISVHLNKDEKWIMTCFEPECAMQFMGDHEGIAFLNVHILGTPTKEQCLPLTKDLCALLNEKLGVAKDRIYVTYYPTDFWGWNDMDF